LVHKLAEFVGMLRPNNLPINIDLPIVFIDNNKEISMSTSYNANNKNQLDMSGIDEVETIDLSEAIN
jgi:hypothetical protein